MTKVINPVISFLLGMLITLFLTAYHHSLTDNREHVPRDILDQACKTFSNEFDARYYGQDTKFNHLICEHHIEDSNSKIVRNPCNQPNRFCI